MRNLSIEHARQEGLAYILCNAEGDIKAAGNDKRLLYLCSKRRENDIIIKTTQYGEFYPNREK